MFSGVRDVFQNAIHDVSQRFDPNGRRGQTRRSTQSRQQQQQEVPPTPQRAPPASIKAIRQLPMIRVAPEDLVDQNNRECCVCLEDNKLDEKVIRLPCAHIFHASCIVDWLANHSCTCPVCRYELPTDDPQYEAGRIERMNLRKPRYAMHELQRMPVSELLKLRRGIPISGVFDKKDLIQTLVSEEWIDVIPSPEPVEYELDVLKRMRIGELKRTMEEAGVFFRREDVVEKSDMITVFENSGRLILIRSEPEDATSTILSNDDDSLRNGASDESGLSPMTDDSSQADEYEMELATETNTQNQVVVETVHEDPSNIEEEDVLNNKKNEEMLGSPIVMFPNREAEMNEAMDEHPSRAGTVPTESSREISSPLQGHAGMHSLSDSELLDHDVQNPSDVEIPTQQQAFPENATPEHGISSVDENEINSERRPEAQTNAEEFETMEIDPTVLASIDLMHRGTDLRKTFDHYTISHFQTLGRDLQVDLSHCIERDDMIDTFLNAGITGNPDPLTLSPLMFSSWSISKLRAVASEINIDLSECATGDEMIEKILHVGNVERPYLRDYLRSLSPLTTKSLSELRAIARDLQINISDCLEKKEIIRRLIKRGR